MVDHPNIISMPTRTTNGMQMVASIYIRKNLLLKVKLPHYTVRAIFSLYLTKLKKTMSGTIDVHKSMTNV